MIHAYDEIYLSTARRTLAHLLDIAANGYGLNLAEFYGLFLVSSIAERFQRGECAIVAGRSGAELYEMIMEESGFDSIAESSIKKKKPVPQKATYNKSREYWAGFVLAYYQWYSGKTFRQIEREIPIEKIRELYTPYHEMDIRQFCDIMEQQAAQDSTAETRLSYYRKKLGMSQRELAEAAEIPVRTIQQYEQRQKDINHARAVYMLRLSKVLRCQMQELMEQNHRQDILL